MSATLTWYNSGLGTKTGTAIGNYFTDMKTLFDSKAADSNFKWEVAASSLAGTPYYLWLRRKDGSNGRILLVAWSSSPAGNNAAILDGAPTTNNTYLAYFPNGTAASPSNLTASSGTISGDDTNCVRCSSCNSIASLYGTSYQPYYFECQEAIFFCTSNPAGTISYMSGAGEIVVDSNDVAYGAVYGAHTAATSVFGASVSPIMPFLQNGATAGSASGAYIKTNYLSQSLNSNSIAFFHAFFPSGNLNSVTTGPSEVFSDSSTTDVWFVPVPLVASGIKGGGFPLKLRQIAWGPPSLGQFTVYNTTGPVPQARNISASTTPQAANPWFLNFKI